MPTFETPTPIDLAINLPVGRIEVFASDRLDSVVTVLPTNPNKSADQRGADETKVEFDGERLTVRGPKPRVAWVGPNESVDIRVELPTRSRLAAEIGVGGVTTKGLLGASRIKSGLGGVDVEATADLWVRASHGNATVGSADGDIEVTTDHGQIRVGTVTGTSLLKASHGSITVNEAGGDVEAKLSYGDLQIGAALAGVVAKTAYGSIDLREVSAGSIDVASGFGAVTISVKKGVAAWLDLGSKSGHTRSTLEGDAPPAPGEPSVAVRARTQFGDISIERAA